MTLSFSQDGGFDSGTVPAIPGRLATLVKTERFYKNSAVIFGVNAKKRIILVPPWIFLRQNILGGGATPQHPLWAYLIITNLLYLTLDVILIKKF